MFCEWGLNLKDTIEKVCPYRKVVFSFQDFHRGIESLPNENLSYKNALS